MGKLLALLVLIVLPGISSHAFALDAEDCELQASRMKSAVRTDFLTSCLVRLASPENVRQVALQKKRAVCERNAKNLSLRNDWKSRYIGTCLERNDAALAYAAPVRKYVLRVTLEQREFPRTRKPAPVVSIVQKAARQRGRQIAACKDS